MIVMNIVARSQTRRKNNMARKMTDNDRYKIERKIIKLIREGYGRDQAVAIAYNMWREGRL